MIDYCGHEQHRLRAIFEQRDSFYRECSQLGNLLKQTLLVAPECIQAALEKQRKSKARFGDIFISRGHLSPESLADVLALQTMFRRTALSAVLALAASVVSIPQVNSQNLSATGQMSITLRITDSHRPVLLESPERFQANENIELSLDATGRVHQLALRLDRTKPRLEVGPEAEILPRPDGQGERVLIDDFVLEFQVSAQDGRSVTMSILLALT